MAEGDVIFRVHAIQRMFERGISDADVRDVLENGEQIESYPDDLPFASRLLLGFCGGRPLHVVAGEDLESGTTIVVTVYEPDPARWDAAYKRRR